MSPGPILPWRSSKQISAANVSRSGRAFVGALPPGSLQPGLDVDEACEVLDLMAGPEGWSRLVTEAGWTPERYEAWLADAIERLITGPAPSG